MRWNEIIMIMLSFTALKEWTQSRNTVFALAIALSPEKYFFENEWFWLFTQTISK